jgi:hypothetical protein
MAIKTKQGAIRRYDAILRRCRRDMAGGLTFGMDWPTLRITFPDRYAELQDIRARFDSLPDRRIKK